MMEQWYTSNRVRSILQISPQCLYAMRKNGRIVSKRVSARKYLYRLPDGFTRHETRKTAIYARVSTTKQRKDLESQVAFLRQYVVANGNEVDNDLVFTDIASGMNENRKGLADLITGVMSGNVSKVVISNRDRLTRFGYGYLKSLFERFDCEIVEVNLTDGKTFEQELADDLISIVHHFSMRFYGKRRNRLKKIEREFVQDKASTSNQAGLR